MTLSLSWFVSGSWLASLECVEVRPKDPRHPEKSQPPRKVFFGSVGRPALPWTQQTKQRSKKGVVPASKTLSRAEYHLWPYECLVGFSCYQTLQPRHSVLDEDREGRSDRGDSLCPDSSYLERLTECVHHRDVQQGLLHRVQQPRPLCQRIVEISQAPEDWGVLLLFRLRRESAGRRRRRHRRRR